MHENEPQYENAQFFYVYILHCGDGDHYTGGTSNLKERINRHRKGWIEVTKKQASGGVVRFLTEPKLLNLNNI